MSEIEVADQLPADPLREFRDLGKDRLAFGGGVLHDDEPIPGIGAGFKAAQPMGDPVFEIGGLSAGDDKLRPIKPDLAGCASALWWLLSSAGITDLPDIK